MNTQYQVPIGLCQWCYKTNGRLIIDCLCLVCESCFNTKKDWVDQNSKCFNCDKKTTRRFIDLKHNQQQASLYFGNITHSIQNFQMLHEFQQEVARKYSRHLQSKVTKLEAIIRVFVAKFPQHQQFFENAFRQIKQNENKNAHRSKSAQLQIPENCVTKMPIHQNNTQRNLPNLPMKNQHIQKLNPQNHQKYQQNQKIINMPQQHEKKEKNYISGSKASSHASMESNFSGIYPNQNHQVKKYGHQNQQNFESIPKNKVRKDQQKMMVNPSKGPIQGYPQIQPSQLYVFGGSKKVSDPRKQHQPIKLNNAVNIQTAIRSIRSDDEREYESNQKSRQMVNHEKPQPNQYMYQQNGNLGGSRQDEDNFFKKFGRKSK